MEVMGGKWKSCIIQELSLGAKRPSELHRLFEEASPRVINQQLKELEMHGIVKKKIFSELPPHSEYSITETGKSLLPIIEQLEEWGDHFRPTMKKTSRYGGRDTKLAQAEECLNPSHLFYYPKLHYKKWKPR